MICALPDEAATVRLAQRLAAVVQPELATTRLLVRLPGDLGAGKTTLVRALLRALGHVGRVPSPTYTLLEPYRLADGSSVLHLDLYRLHDPQELEFLGWRDLSAAPGLILVEWPEKGGGWLRDADLQIALRHAGAGREARIEAFGATGAQVLARLALCSQDGLE